MKVIGYFTSWNEEIGVDEINYNCLTHINYAFLIPKKDGEIIELDETKIINLIDRAHKNNVKVFISVGGWCYQEQKLDKTFENICDNQRRLDLFIENILNTVDKYKFDGVDIDWEYPTEEYSAQYEYLLKKLKLSLVKEEKRLSIAIPPGINVDNTITNISAITNKVIELVDWINLMVYDNPIEQNHSTYEYAKIAIDYWLNKRKCPKEKIVLGIPFYTRPSNCLYADIVNEDNVNCKKDQFKNEYYNGIPTIKKKTELAIKKASGIMIWAINYDTLNQYSLLKTVNDVIENSN